MSTGLVAFSEAEARKVIDPQRDETAAKLGGVYQEIGKLVQNGTISQKKLRAAWDLSFDAATGNSKEHWLAWKKATDDKYIAVDFQSAEDAFSRLRDCVVDTEAEAYGESQLGKSDIEVPSTLSSLAELSYVNALEKIAVFSFLKYCLLQKIIWRYTSSSEIEYVMSMGWGIGYKDYLARENRLMASAANVLDR